MSGSNFMDGSATPPPLPSVLRRDKKAQCLYRVKKLAIIINKCHLKMVKCTCQILGGCQGRRTGVGVTTISNSLILGGWVTNVLKNGDKKQGGGSVGDNNILTFLCYWLDKKVPLKKNCILRNFFCSYL